MSGRSARFPVLAIEDSDADIRLLREAFQECDTDCDLTVVRNQSLAWSVLSTRPVGLVITHSGNGMGEVAAFVRQLRAQPHLQAIPVVLFSGSYETNAAYATGVNVFLRKTVDLDSFFQKIKALVHFWMYVAEWPVSPPEGFKSTTGNGRSIGL